MGIRTRTVLAVLAAVLLFCGTDPALAAEAEHQGGLPQFNPAFFLTQIFWLFTIFGTFYLLIQGIGVPAVVRALEARDAKIAYEITRAQTLRNEAGTIMKAIEDSVLRAREHAQTVVTMSQREVDGVTKARLAMFDARIEGQVRDAERRIATSRERFMREMPEVASSLARSIIGHISEGPAIADEQVASAVSRVIKEC
ncbi:MAG: hypothetical protein WCF85_09535 [Rhodospirillaceae bacterium]